MLNQCKAECCNFKTIQIVNNNETFFKSGIFISYARFKPDLFLNAMPHRIVRRSPWVDTTKTVLIMVWEKSFSLKSLRDEICMDKVTAINGQQVNQGATLFTGQTFLTVPLEMNRSYPIISLGEGRVAQLFEDF